MVYEIIILDSYFTVHTHGKGYSLQCAKVVFQNDYVERPTKSKDL